MPHLHSPTLILLFSRLPLKLICHRVDFETVKAGCEFLCRGFGSEFWVDHEEHVGEASSEIAAVCVVVFGGFWGMGGGGFLTIFLFEEFFS